jgi:diguanylate cyclase (GGDEF)-like protein
MDADDFKWFNDNKSYAAGNEVLKAIVNAVKAVVRPTDEFCRWGGEEFILLILGADIKGGAVAADKILNTIRTNSRIKQLEKEYGRKISVSIGLACFHPENPITEFTNEDISRVSAALFMRSGVALKQAKKNGKDQMFESESFKLGEEGSDKDIFPIKVLIITNDKQYEQMSIHGVNITVVSSIEEAAIITKKYDISIVDIKNEKEDVESII